MQATTSTTWGNPGTVIADRYRLDQPIVKGAMGTIWRAEHLRLKAPVAVKLLDPVLARDHEMRGRFLQEARSAAAVRSSHVVQIFDSGIEEGFPYLVMEWLEGEGLDTRLNEGGPLTPAELRKIFGEVARALAKAHSLGVVHRDVKPSNIFLSREGPYEVTKLVDFGIAKVKSEALQFTHVGTKIGTLLGTPQYMSPEQARGSCTVDYRTDLWAMAIVACECLTGRCPFSGKTVGDLTIQICTERPTAPSQLGDVPAGFDAWFFKATGKTPGQRFKSMAAMEGALTPVLVAAEARAVSVSASHVGVGRRWSLPSLPSVSQIRSVSVTLMTRIESRWRKLRSSLRNRLHPWFCLLPEERRRLVLIALLSGCGVTLLAVSSLRRPVPRPHTALTQVRSPAERAVSAASAQVRATPPVPPVVATRAPGMSSVLGLRAAPLTSGAVQPAALVPPAAPPAAATPVAPPSDI